MNTRSTRPKTMRADAVVVGQGILGLLLAKRLLDVGQKVVVIERSKSVAHGSSIKNHGWIHQGTTHTLSAKDVAQGKEIAKQLQYGHAFFAQYAPESFDEPFEPTYAYTQSAARAEEARRIWTACGVPFEELTREQFARAEPAMDLSKAAYFFRVADSRINNQLLFMKLWAEIKRHGAAIFTGASYEYADTNCLHVTADQGDILVEAPLFFYATGVGTEEAYHALTGKDLPMLYYKSHLLYTPLVTQASAIGLDSTTPIIINHGSTSVINRPHDEVQTHSADYSIDQREVERTLALVGEIYPEAAQLTPADIRAAACLKPCLLDEDADGLCVNAIVREPLPGHIFALPGKMTAAPYLADTLLRRVTSQLHRNDVTERPFKTDVKPSLRLARARVSRVS